MEFEYKKFSDNERNEIKKNTVNSIAGTLYNFLLEGAISQAKNIILTTSQKKLKKKTIYNIAINAYMDTNDVSIKYGIASELNLPWKLKKESTHDLIQIITELHGDFSQVNEIIQNSGLYHSDATDFGEYAINSIKDPIDKYSHSLQIPLHPITRIKVNLNAIKSYINTNHFSKAKQIICDLKTNDKSQIVKMKGINDKMINGYEKSKDIHLKMIEKGNTIQSDFNQILNIGLNETPLLFKTIIKNLSKQAIKNGLSNLAGSFVEELLTNKKTRDMGFEIFENIGKYKFSQSTQKRMGKFLYVKMQMENKNNSAYQIGQDLKLSLSDKLTAMREYSGLDLSKKDLLREIANYEFKHEDDHEKLIKLSKQLESNNPKIIKVIEGYCNNNDFEHLDKYKKSNNISDKIFNQGVAKAAGQAVLQNRIGFANRILRKYKIEDSAIKRQLEISYEANVNNKNFDICDAMLETFNSIKY